MSESFDNISSLDADIGGSFSIEKLFAKIQCLPNSCVTEERIYLAALAQLQLLREKNAKYGDAWRMFGVKGVIQRLIERFIRLKNLVWDEKTEDWKLTAQQILHDLESSGSVYAELVDICGYSILALTLFGDAAGWQLENSIKAIRQLLRGVQP